MNPFLSQFTLIKDPFFSTIGIAVAILLLIVVLLSIALVLYNINAVQRERRSQVARTYLRGHFLQYLKGEITWDQVESACLKNRNFVLGILLQLTEEIDITQQEKLVLLIHSSPSLNSIFLEQVKNLSSTNWQERRRAASLLPFTAPIDDISAELIKALNDTVFSVRISAANALSKSKVTASILPILTELLSGTHWPRERLIEILNHFGNSVEQPLIKLLTHY
jgi:hypothetical protein